MTLPAFVFGLVVAAFLGAAFHVWRGGSFWQLILYLAASCVGFAAGQILAEQLGWAFADAGPLHLGPAVLGSAVCLGVGYWLSLVKVENKA